MRQDGSTTAQITIGGGFEMDFTNGGISGDVDIDGGTFRCEEDFCTTGELHFADSSVGSADGVIYVVKEYTAKFSQSCP